MTWHSKIQAVITLFAARFPATHVSVDYILNPSQIPVAQYDMIALT